MTILERGAGPTVVMVHGSATDAQTWSIQLASLASQLRMVAPHRRSRASVEAFADDIAALIDERGGGPVFVCGSSFGAVILLDVARRYPDRLRGMVLCEPPLPATDWAPGVPAGFGCHFDRLVSQRGGEAAAEFFLRTVLGDAAFESLPRRWQQRACGLWREIRADSAALARYRVRYDQLDQVVTPALLLGGERSTGLYRPTLDALERALPNVRRQTLRGAGHMMHADAHRQFNAALVQFVTRRPPC